MSRIKKIFKALFISSLVLMAIGATALIIGVSQASSSHQKEIGRLPLATTVISEGEGTIAKEPFGVLGGEFLVARVMIGNEGMIPVLLNPQQEDDYRMMQKQGRRVKFRCIFYGYGKGLAREICTFNNH